MFKKIGLFTWLAAIPLLVNMLVAIVATKVALLGDNGLWSTLYVSRTDWAMLLGSIFLLIKGGGKWSLDKKIMKPAWKYSYYYWPHYL